MTPPKTSSELERLRDENARLQVLLHFAQNLQTELKLENLLLTTMQEVARILKADRCSVFLLDEAKGELWSIVALGIERGKEIRFPADKGLAGYVAMTGEILNIPDAYQDPRFNQEIDKKTGYHTRTILTTPLKNKQNEIIGVVQILNKKDGVFDARDEELMMALSQIAATAIENSLLYQEQVESLYSFVETLSATLDTRDYITAGHSRRVTQYTLALCEILEMDESCCEQLRVAGLLHDIGKLGIPESILFKKGKLTEEEYKIIKNHPAVTREILQSIRFPRNLRKVPNIAATHHEKFDGSGYPEGLKGEEIPLGGRIMAMADVFDALTSRRQYRDREPLEVVWERLEKDSGTAFDPDMPDFFGRISARRILEIMEPDVLKSSLADELARFEKIPLIDIVQLKRKTPENMTIAEKEILDLFDKIYWRQY